MNLAIALLYSSAVFSLLIFFYYFLGYRSQKRESASESKKLVSARAAEKSRQPAGRPF